MNPPTPRQRLLQVSREAARQGFSFDAVIKGLLPEYQYLIDDMRKAYEGISKGERAVVTP